MDVLQHNFAKIVLKSAYTLGSGQIRIGLPGRMDVSFALPFDLWSISIQLRNVGRVKVRVKLT